MSRSKRLEAEQHILGLHTRGLLHFYPEHRKLPVPVFYLEAAPKHCRWCGEPVNEPRRTCWHARCKEQMEVWIWGDPRRCFHPYVCAICGNGAAELDHERALVNSKGDPTAHFLSNLRPLCLDCHKTKTQRDMAEKRRAKGAHSVFHGIEQSIVTEAQPEEDEGDE